MPCRFRSGYRGAQKLQHLPVYPRTTRLFFRDKSRGHCAHIGQLATVHYRWHPLYGRSMRLVLTEQRASGQIAHVELAPGNVTMVAAWKLDPAICDSMHIGAPQVSPTALRHLHELLVACESRLNSLDDNTVQEKVDDDITDTDRSNSSDTTGSQANVKSQKNRAAVRSRARRRGCAGHDASGSSGSAQVAGAAVARSGRGVKRGERR